MTSGEKQKNKASLRRSNHSFKGLTFNLITFGPKRNAIPLKRLPRISRLFSSTVTQKS